MRIFSMLFLVLMCGSLFANEIAPAPKLDWGLIISNLPELLIGLFGAIIAIALLIPGEQPEKFLKSAVEFLEKFSKK